MLAHKLPDNSMLSSVCHSLQEARVVGPHGQVAACSCPAQHDRPVHLWPGDADHHLIHPPASACHLHQTTLFSLAQYCWNLCGAHEVYLA